MSTTVKKIYLAKGQEIVGPLLKSDLDRLQKTGEIANYHFIWDDGAESWQPLNVAPRMSPEAYLKQNNTDDALAQSYCVWNGGIVRGQVRQLSSLGFEFEFTQEGLAPSVVESSPVMIVMRKDRGQEQHPLQVSRVEKKIDSWVLHLRTYAN